MVPTIAYTPYRPVLKGTHAEIAAWRGKHCKREEANGSGLEVSNLLGAKEQSTAGRRAALVKKTASHNVIDVSKRSAEYVANAAWHMKYVVKFDG